MAYNLPTTKRFRIKADEAANDVDTAVSIAEALLYRSLPRTAVVSIVDVATSMARSGKSISVTFTFWAYRSDWACDRAKSHGDCPMGHGHYDGTAYHSNAQAHQDALDWAATQKETTDMTTTTTKAEGLHNVKNVTPDTEAIDAAADEARKWFHNKVRNLITADKKAKDVVVDIMDNWEDGRRVADAFPAGTLITTAIRKETEDAPVTQRRVLQMVQSERNARIVAKALGSGLEASDYALLGLGDMANMEPEEQRLIISAIKARSETEGIMTHKEAKAIKAKVLGTGGSSASGSAGYQPALDRIMNGMFTLAELQVIVKTAQKAMDEGTYSDAQ